jgi:hypothetical protein
MKPSAQFRERRPDCRSCERAACRAYGAANRPKRNARLSSWRRANPEKAAAADRRKHLKANCGLTEQQVEAMRLAQGGHCALCLTDGPLVIDHCHETGRVRGLVCTPCNTALGHAEARGGWLGRAAVYLASPCHADVLLELANSRSEGSRSTEKGEC